MPLSATLQAAAPTGSNSHVIMGDVLGWVMKRLRQFFESIVFAGIKPDKPEKRLGWLGPLAGPLNRFLDGGAANDPMYLTNRTMGQKVRLAIVVMVPCLLVVGGIGLALAGYFNHPPPPPRAAPALTPAQIAAKMLPNLDKDLKIDSNRDIEVADVHIEQGGATKVAGRARNTTDHIIQNAEIIFDLTDKDGSRLGAVSAKIPRIEAHGSAQFSLPVEQREAYFALVREIRQP